MPDNAADLAADELHTATISLLRVEAGMRQAALDRLVKLQAELTGTVATSTGLSVNKAAKLAALLKQTDATIARAYDEIGVDQNGKLKELAVVSGKSAKKAVDVQLGAAVSSVAIAPKTLEAVVDDAVIFGHSSKDWWAGQSVDLQQKFRGQMQQGILLGESTDELVRRVMGTKANDYKDGVMTTPKRNAEALVRSSVIAVTNEAKLRTYAEMGDLVKGIQWLATLDTRTTPICIALDKKVWRLPDYAPVGHDKKFPGSTAHWNCRSTQLPVLRSWEELSGKKLPTLDDQKLDEAVRKKLAAAGWEQDRIDKAQIASRASMNGELASSTNWQEWLTNKTDAFQQRLLGPGRAELFKAGKLTVSDLTDQDNRPLTIAELETAIDAGELPVETTGAPFMPLLSAVAPFTQAVVDVLNREATKQIGALAPDSEVGKQVKAVLANEPDLEAKDALAKAQTLAAINDAAKSKAIKLGMIKAKLVKGEVVGPGYILTQKDNDVLATLTDEELKAFWDGTNDAATVGKGKAAQKAAATALDEFKAKSPVHAAAASSAAGKTAVDKLASAQQQLDTLAGEELDKLLATGSVGDKAVVKGLLKSNPKTWDTLTTAKATIVEKKAQAAQTSALTGAKKSYLAGKPFTAVQQAAWDTLEPSQVTDLLGEWQQLKAAESAAKAAAAVPSMTGPDLKVQNLSLAPPDLNNATLVRTLPGTTSPELWKDNATGKQWVVKSSTSLAHLENEARTDGIYRAAGVPVPFSTMMEDHNGKRVKVAEFLEGGQTLKAYLATADAFDRAAILGDIQDNFVADALLGNWDVAGLTLDNILVVNGKAWRIDNGSGLTYRAQGAKKTADWLTPEVRELKTLLDAKQNPQTAEVFRGVTPSMVHQQIADLVNRREAILDAAGADRALVASRLDWLEKQLPAGMSKPKPAAGAKLASYVPDTHVARIATAGSKGYTYLGDGPDIEDHSVLMWPERKADGSPVLKMHLKTTPDGDKRVVDVLKGQGINLTAPAPTYGSSAPKAVVNSHPSDSYWNTIEVAAKNVNYHANDGNYNAAKVQAMQKVKAELKGFVAAGQFVDPDAKHMVDLYLAHIEQIENAMGAKATTHKLEQYVMKPKAKPAAAPAPAAPVAKWTVAKDSTWKATVKRVDPDGVPVDTGSPNYAPNVGNVVTLTRPGVKVQYGLHTSNSSGKSHVGTMEVEVDGNADPSTVAEGLHALEELGLNVAPTSQAQKELLYLHKVVFLNGNHLDLGYSKLWNDTAMDPAAKVDAIKTWAEGRYNVKLPRTGSTVDYNPDGFDDDAGTGRKFWYRWDMPRSKVEKEMKGHVLHHASSNPVAALDGWLNNGGLVTTTYERLRIGVDINATGGTSSTADIGTGGAVHFYNNILPESRKGPGFVFKIRNLARADLLSVNYDAFGAWTAYANRQATPAQWKATAAKSRPGGMTDGALLKNGINLLEEVEEIIVSSQAQKDQMLAVLRKHGVTTLADGRLAANVVKVK